MDMSVLADWDCDKFQGGLQLTAAVKKYCFSIFGDKLLDPQSLADAADFRFDEQVSLSDPSSFVCLTMNANPVTLAGHYKETYGRILSNPQSLTMLNKELKLPKLNSDAWLLQTEQNEFHSTVSYLIPANDTLTMNMGALVNLLSLWLNGRLHVAAQLQLVSAPFWAMGQGDEVELAAIKQELETRFMQSGASASVERLVVPDGCYLWMPKFREWRKK